MVLDQQDLIVVRDSWEYTRQDALEDAWHEKVIEACWEEDLFCRLKEIQERLEDHGHSTTKIDQVLEDYVAEVSYDMSTKVPF